MHLKLVPRSVMRTFGARADLSLAGKVYQKLAPQSEETIATGELIKTAVIKRKK